MAITKQKINNILLFLFLLICIFFPGDPYKVKFVFLALLFAINAICIFESLFTSRFKPVMLIGLFFPLLAMIQSFLLASNLGAAVSGAYSPMILLLLIPIIRYDLKFRDYVLLLLKWMSLCTIALALADIARIYNVNGNNFIRTSFYRFDMGLMGKSPQYSSYYRIFFKASPLLVLLLDDAITRNHKRWVVLSFIALWFSGTRANVFSALIILFMRYVFWNDSKMTQKVRVLLSIALAFGAVISSPIMVNLISRQMNTSGAVASDSVRSGELKAYFEVFLDPLKFLFGSGFGSSFYNYGREAIAYTSELSYFELIRSVGLILSVPFFCFVGFPLFSSKIPRGRKLAYICYLVIAATNPLLFSSTAMIMYMFLYQSMIRMEKDRKGKWLRPIIEQA